MKQIILILIVGGMAFAGSAVLSWYLQQQSQHPSKQDSSLSEGDKLAKLSHSGSGSDKGNPVDSGPGAPLRPLPTLNPENVVAVAEKVRQQQEGLRLREQQFATQKKQWALIYEDIKSEIKTYDDLKKQLDAEKKAIADKWDTIERKSNDLKKQGEQNLEKIHELERTMGTVEQVEARNFKTFDKMEPVVAGELLQKMVDSGKMDTAARILATMKDSQAAAVLSQIDRDVAIQLVDRLKGLKRPSKQETDR